MDTPLLQNDSRRILVLQADRLLADFLADRAAQVLPGSHVRTATTFFEAGTILDRSRVDLLIGGLTLPDGCLLEFLFERPALARLFDRVLAVGASLKPSMLRHLRGLGVAGVMDLCADGTAIYADALRQVGAGFAYWSVGARRQLELEALSSGSLLRRLTPKEELVFAAIGDGSDDSAAAQRLDMNSTTVQTVRRDVHHKIGCHCRSQLIGAAVEHGVVQFMPWGIVRPGFALLQEAYRRRGCRAPLEKKSA